MDNDLVGGVVEKISHEETGPDGGEPSCCESSHGEEESASEHAVYHADYGRGGGYCLTSVEVGILRVGYCDQVVHRFSIINLEDR